MDAEDEEVVMKGSALYEHLHNSGFTNFESYVPNRDKPERFAPDISCMQISQPAPQWAIDQLNCILRSGLTLEDHRHFIESYYPLQIQKIPETTRNLLFCSAPLICLFGGLHKVAKVPGLQTLLSLSMGVGCLCGISLLRKSFHKRSMNQSLNKLQLALGGLEKVLIQLKKMLLLVHQNEFISQNISLRQREMLELKKTLRSLLINAVEKFDQLLQGLIKVPLAINVDTVLSTFSLSDLSDIPDTDVDSVCSLDHLKKLFNSFILLQSEYLRRLALCYCPDIWCKSTSLDILSYSQNIFPDIIGWSSEFHRTLIMEQKLFRTVMESKEKFTQSRIPSSSGWDYSDVYISVRSASVHFQSLLLQTQSLQDILETKHADQTKNNVDFMNSIAQILNEISKEVHAGKACIDGSLVQIFKMISGTESAANLSEPKEISSPELISGECVDTICNEPVEDEVFELMIPYEELNQSDDDWDDIPPKDHSGKNEKADTSEKVLQELKTVLVKKAEEWKAREQKAMESKGILYTAPEQVQSHLPLQERNLSHSNERLDFLPTSDGNDWPLPRLKGSLQTRRRGSRVEKNKVNPMEQVHDLEGNGASRPQEDVKAIPRVGGFGASLLAEAMARSKAMKNRKEEVFIDSDDDSSSGDESS